MCSRLHVMNTASRAGRKKTKPPIATGLDTHSNQKRCQRRGTQSQTAKLHRKHKKSVILTVSDTNSLFCKVTTVFFFNLINRKMEAGKLKIKTHANQFTFPRAYLGKHRLHPRGEKARLSVKRRFFHEVQQ